MQNVSRKVVPGWPRVKIVRDMFYGRSYGRPTYVSARTREDAERYAARLCTHVRNAIDAQGNDVSYEYMEEYKVVGVVPTRSPYPYPQD